MKTIIFNGHLLTFKSNLFAFIELVVISLLVLGDIILLGLFGSALLGAASVGAVVDALIFGGASLFMFNSFWVLFRLEAKDTI